VDAPEPNRPGGKEAKAFTQSICPISSTATIDDDEKQTPDKYNRTIAVVYCNNTNLNEALLINGHAFIDKRYCNISEFKNEDWVKIYERYFLEGFKFLSILKYSMKTAQIEFFNGLDQLPNVPKGATYALSGIRKGVIDSIQTVSNLALGSPKNYPQDQRRGCIFFYETKKDPKIEEPLKKSLKNKKVDLSSFRTLLPFPHSTKKIIEKKYFIVIPHKNISTKMPLPSTHFENAISIITTHDLGKGYYCYEEEKNEVFTRGYVMGAHMTGHLLLDKINDGHCEDTACCMHPHLSGLTDINKIIKARTKEKREDLFCKKSLGQFRSYLDSLERKKD